jgi:dynein heavy chain
MRKNLVETSPTINNNLVDSLLRIMDCFLIIYKEDELNKVKEEDLKKLDKIGEELFVFSYVWSVCATVDYDGRISFDKFIRK